MRFWIRILAIIASAPLMAPTASAFSLNGPAPEWQTVELGYNELSGVMNLGEEYRWTIPEITYAYDPSFLNYFGERGVQAIDEAVQMINNLPSMSSLSHELTEYQFDTRRFNHQASALSLLDLKSFALALLLEELGLSSPERYVWTLRARERINNIDFFSTIMRNFDPVTLQPSPYVNGTLYSYQIFEIVVDTEWEAVAFALDPFEPAGTSVVNLTDSGSAFFRTIASSSPGMFFTGLTRDDVGGLRYLYRNSNYNVETLYPFATSSLFGAGNPWGPGSGVGGTNAALVNIALRPGIDELKLTRVWYDSVLGQFTTLTNRYVDRYVTNGVVREQGIELTVPQPHIIFGAADLGVVQYIPITFSREVAFTNNAALNNGGLFAAEGPGQVVPTVVIEFSKVGPYYLNVEETGQDTATFGFVWGSFDGTTNAPVVYPVGTSIRELEAFVLSDRSRQEGISPWEIPQGTVIVQQGQGAGGGGAGGAGGGTGN